LVVETAPGAVLEHVSFNTASASLPLLGQPWFRRALAYALDRAPLFPAAFGDISPDLGVQQSLIHPLGHADYSPSFAGYSFDASAAAQIMTANGCALGGDGAWSCGGVRASVELATTADNEARETVVEELSTRAAAAGFELVPDYIPVNQFVTRLESGQFEAMVFAWLKNADSVVGSRALYGCSGTQNFTGYCSAVTTDLLVRAEAEPDPAARAALGNEADVQLAVDVPEIPLFQRPAFLASAKTLQGPRNNPSVAGPTWNVEEWYRGSFADVPPSNPFYGYIERLFEQGITTGCGTNGSGELIFCPTDSVPRQQMAAFLIRAFD
jgi:peptide/nickel transport system substrate-binding protein